MDVPAIRQDGGQREALSDAKMKMEMLSHGG